jgi:hypothetical protein
LIVLGREAEAKTALEKAVGMLGTRFDAVSNTAYRRTMIQRVEEHVAILDLAQKLDVPHGIVIA